MKLKIIKKDQLISRSNMQKMKKALIKRAPRKLKDNAKTVLNAIQELKQSSVSPNASLINSYPNIPTNFSPSSTQYPRFQNIKAAVIMDEFSFSSWSPEFDLIPIKPDSWPTVFDSEIDMLFVESAWAGNNGAWQYQLTGTNAPSGALKSLVTEFQKRGIPTIFWNKEDPPHFEDFLKTACLFDIIFTTDENMIPRYMEQVGHDRIYALPFAAQPVFHNPARNHVQYAEGDIAFAGTYFRHKFVNRHQQMDLLLGAANELAERGLAQLTIFSRHFKGELKYQFPIELNKHVAGSLPYDNMLTAYRAFKVFLNVNSVTDSPSMCARRIFEIVASGTAVVTTRSEAIPNFFAQDEVPLVDTQFEAQTILRTLINSPELRERMIHKAQRKIWENHTYHHRALQVLQQSGLNVVEEIPPTVSIICSTNRDETLDHVLSQVATQTYPKIEFLVLAHGIEFDAKLQDRAKRLGVPIKLLSAPKDWQLGRCLNLLVEQASGEIIAKFDDDDHYSPNYIRDQVLALNYSGADLVGKASIFFHLADLGVMARRWPEKEHKWTNFVAGATFVGPKSTFLSCPFPEIGVGEDSEFLRQLEANNFSVYSSDRFNYMAVRDSSQVHTWRISNFEVLAYSTVESFGFNLSHIEV